MRCDSRARKIARISRRSAAPPKNLSAALMTERFVESEDRHAARPTSETALVRRMKFVPEYQSLP